MIIYQSIKQSFLNDVLSNKIELMIHSAYKNKTGKSVGFSEVTSWKESMRAMGALLMDEGIPNDTGVVIEFNIPQTSKRLDCTLTGYDEKQVSYAIIIELKQWSEAELTNKDGIVRVRYKGGVGETNHPSYQAWSYAAILNGFCEAVYEKNIQLKPCAYLHNYSSDQIIDNDCYADYIEKAPLFLKGDEEQEKLRLFIKKYIKRGDGGKIIFTIEEGRIRPSKSLADSMARMLKGNQEFVMVDDQKVVYETALALAKQSSSTKKNVLIVEGGPGTGKSVVAVNLLVALTKLGLVTKYVTKNAAPRAVYESKLTGTLKKTEFSNMFSGSGSFCEAEENIFDALIVDEAHRLNEKSGMFKNIGENQIKEVIEASKCSVFFIDEDQRVTFSDIGEKSEIVTWAQRCGVAIHSLELASQFRCNGSDGYLAWLDDVLQIRGTANSTLSTEEYDFRVVDSPNELRDIIFEKNRSNNKARMVAGYCWDWVSKKDSQKMDIVFPEYSFGMQWNLASDGSLWILSPESVKQIGCIHTCQGLEVDYIGVIIGPDLIIRNGKVITAQNMRARTDKSLNGYNKLLKQSPDVANKRADEIIKNTYRTLMTRGMKGCYVYSVDKETEQYIRSRIINL